jgi:hypothetical protein
MSELLEVFNVNFRLVQYITVHLLVCDKLRISKMHDATIKIKIFSLLCLSSINNCLVTETVLGFWRIRTVEAAFQSCSVP